MRILVAEDHELTRRGMKALIESRPDWSVVSEAADGISALHEIESEQPDVAILDLALPGMHGLDVLRESKRRSPATCCIVLSMHSEPSLVARALKNGADGYVLKGARAEDLIDAIDACALSEPFLSAGLRDLDLAVGDDSSADRYESLTPREREVLTMTAEGLTSQGIADRLFISPRTVEKHRENMMAKLGLKNQTEVVRFVMSRGLLS
jgi:DNA-binding NarL/FixJ family response regulator